jgi:uncharacterized protein (DUF433 family)
LFYYKKIDMEQNNLLNRITTSPTLCHGKPCIRNMRYPVVVILDLLAAGETTENILKEFPDLEEADIRACLAYAVKVIERGNR